MKKSERNLQLQGREMGEQDLRKNKKKFAQNKERMGGRGGLSLEAFANAKTWNNNYNPAIIKKQREFYKNAKYVQRYKRSLNQLPNVPSTGKRPLECESETSTSKQNKRSKNKGPSLRELYEKKREEGEKAMMEREAAIQSKNEARQQSEARRRTLKEKMLKKTKSGQPVMKYRIEHILETLQGQSS